MRYEGKHTSRLANGPRPGARGDKVAGVVWDGLDALRQGTAGERGGVGAGMASYGRRRLVAQRKFPARRAMRAQGKRACAGDTDRACERGGRGVGKDSSGLACEVHDWTRMWVLSCLIGCA